MVVSPYWPEMTPTKHDADIALFERAVNLALGHREWPLPLAGDLSDLLATLQKGVRLLEELKDTQTREILPERLQRVQLFVDEMRMLVADLVGPLQSVTDEAYSAQSEEPP